MLTWKPNYLAVLLLALLASGLAGCTAARNAFAPVADVAPQREKRSAEAKRHLGETRDRAEYQAAHAFWQEGNIAGCRDLLAGLMARNPTHRDGCLLWAEVSILYDEPEAAIKNLEELAASLPNDAQVVEALRLLKDAAGQSDVALTSYASPMTAKAEPGSVKSQPEEQDYGAQHIATQWNVEGLNGPVQAVCPGAGCAHCEPPVFEAVSPDEMAFPPERAIPSTSEYRPPVRLPQTNDADEEETAVKVTAVEAQVSEPTTVEEAIVTSASTTADGQVFLRFVKNSDEQEDGIADDTAGADLADPDGQDDPSE